MTLSSESTLVLPLLVCSILLNTPINYHPMNLLPSITTSNIADLLSKPLPASTHHRFLLAIGDNTTPSTTSVATATVAPTSALVASTTTVDSLAAVVYPTSDSVPSLHPNPTTLPIVLDTGASYSCTPFPSDFCVAQASYGLFRSPISVVSKALASRTLTSTPVDPYTLITGEDTTVDLSFPDPFDTIVDSDSDSGSPSKVSFDIRQFGTASLTFIFSPNLSLIKVFVTPTQVDWIHWVPLPRLTPTESYFHIFGRDYLQRLQAFALFHLIPLWIALVSALLRSE